MRAGTRRVLRLSLALAAVWVTSTGAILGGCDGLFRPATPQGGGAGGVFADYHDPDACLNTMALGLADKARSNGLTAYLGALSDSSNGDGAWFHAFFAPGVKEAWEQASNRTAPSDWKVAEEQSFYSYFVGLRPLDDYQVQWSQDLQFEDTPGSSTWIVHRQYKVFAVSPEGDARIIALGYADLYFNKVSASRWAMTRWQDRSDPAADPSDTDQITLGRRRLDSQ